MSEVLEIYGFGSYFIKKGTYQDIDILILHENTSEKSCKFAISCKRVFVSKIPKVDITVLSRPEELKNSFIRISGACLIGTVRESSRDDDLKSIIEFVFKRDCILSS